MTKELENRCQVELETLLLQKEQILRRSSKISTEERNLSLPHFKTILALCEALEEDELFLHEINEKVKTLEREKEIEDMKSMFSSLRLEPNIVNDQPSSFIRNWLSQILLAKENTGHSTEMKENSPVKLYFDIDFFENSEEESLTWTTMYKGRCIRICISASMMCMSTDPADYTFSSSFYVDGLIDKGKELITTGGSVEEYVKFLWSGLQSLVDVK